MLKLRVWSFHLVLTSFWFDFCFHSGNFLKCARFLPGFLLITRPDSARIFTKMSPDEEWVTLHWQHQDFRNYSSVPNSPVYARIGAKMPIFLWFCNPSLRVLILRSPIFLGPCLSSEFLKQCSVPMPWTESQGTTEWFTHIKIKLAGANIEFRTWKFTKKSPCTRLQWYLWEQCVTTIRILMFWLWWHPIWVVAQIQMQEMLFMAFKNSKASPPPYDGNGQGWGAVHRI